ncbi:MAG: hypothetical protein JWR21_3688 [Herminiimonas sp.]|nr:hypothetical protein [Herminiimonas sp.]
MSIRVLITLNRGLRPARNAGFQLARGEYLYFFDSDDVIDRIFVASMYEEIERTPNLDLLLFSESPLLTKASPVVT